MSESTRLLVVVGFTELRFDARASIAERYPNIKVRRFLEIAGSQSLECFLSTWPIHLKGIGNSPRPNAIRVRVNTAPTANELQYKNGLSFRLIVDPPLRRTCPVQNPFTTGHPKRTASANMKIERIGMDTSIREKPRRR